MPAGNHHYTPNGFWWQTPSSATLPRLVLGSIRNSILAGLSVVAYCAWRSLQYNHTYTCFQGKTITMGKMTLLTHEPASVEEIDKLKAEEAQRKKKLRS